MRYIAILLALGALFFFQNCGDVHILAGASSNANKTSNVSQTLAETSVCGGARSAGRQSNETAAECSYPNNDDASCDRWGCAVTDSEGNGGCPSGTIQVRLSDNWTYFLCYNPGRLGTIVGGARLYGKNHEQFGGNSCSMPTTTDASCDRWGLAYTANADGDAQCPAGSHMMLTSDSPYYFICVLDNSAGLGAIAGGGREEAKLTFGSTDTCDHVPTSDSSCDRWGSAVTDVTGHSSCPTGQALIRTSDNAGHHYFLCLNLNGN